MTTALGVDTSNHNHPNGAAINFAALAASGEQFAVLKATEGVGFIDRYFAGDRDAAHAAGLLVGIYHFGRPGDPVAQARWFLSVIGPLRVGEFIVLDDEDPGLNPAWVKAFCDTVSAATTVKPLVYMNQSYRDGQNWTAVAPNDGLWLAKYDGSTAMPPGGAWGSPAMKQYTSTGQAAGIVGPVDLDVFYGSIDQLRAYGLGGSPGGSTIVLDADTATQISKIVVNALTTPLIDWSGTNNANTSVLDQLKANAEGLALILQAVQKGTDPQALVDAVVTAIKALPPPAAQEVIAGVLAGLNGAQLNVTQPAPPA